MHGDDTHTLPSRRRDFPEWHRGRERFAVWALALDDAALAQRLAAVRAALQPWLLPGYARQPHLTLHICGFPSPRPRRGDDFGALALQAQLEAVARLAPAPFALRIGGAFSFTSAACLAVDDDAGHLQRLRAACQQAAPAPDATPYVPHVTAGLYAQALPMREVLARLQPLAALPALALPVTALHWMDYDSRCIDGPLRTLLRVRLDNGAIEVPDAAALAAALGAAVPAPG